MTAGQSNHRFNNSGFSIEALEALEVEIRDKYNPNGEDKYETLVHNICDAAKTRLIISTGSGEADRFVARQLLASDADKAVDGLEFLTGRSNLFRLWGVAIKFWRRRDRER